MSNNSEEKATVYLSDTSDPYEVIRNIFQKIRVLNIGNLSISSIEAYNKFAH